MPHQSALLSRRARPVAVVLSLCIFVVGAQLALPQVGLPAAWAAVVLWAAGLGMFALALGLWAHGVRLERKFQHVTQQAERFDGMLRAVTEHSVIATDLQGVISVFNAGAERLLGYRAEELLGKAPAEILHDPQELMVRAQAMGMRPSFLVYVQGIPRRGSRSLELNYVRRDGERVPVTFTVTNIVDRHGKIAGYICISQDQTQAKALEEQKQRALWAERAASEQTRDHVAILESVLAQCTDGIVVVDTHKAVRYINAAARSMPGWGEPDAREETPSGFCLVDGACLVSQYDAPVTRALQGETFSDVRMTFTSWDGHPKTVTLNGGPILDGQGQVTGGLITLREETVRVAREQAHQAVVGQLRALIEAVPVGVAMFDSELRCMSVNNMAARLTGLTLHAGDDSGASGTSPELRQQLMPALEEARRGHPSEMELQPGVLPPGADRSWDVTFFPVCNGGTRFGVGAMFAESTVRRRMETDRNFVANATKSMLAAGQGEVCTQIAKGALGRLADLAFVDLLRDDHVSTVACAHWQEHKVKPLRDALTRMCTMSEYPAREVVLTQEVQLRAVMTWEGTPDGPGVFAQRERELLRSLGVRSLVRLPLHVGQRRLGVLTLAYADSGRTYGAVELALAVQYASFAGLAVEDSLHFDAKCEAVRQRDGMLAVVSHDLRNPLAAIALAAQRLQRRFADSTHEDGDKALRCAVTVLESVNRANRLIADLLDISSIAEGRLSIRRTAQSPVHLAQQALESVGLLASQRQVLLESDVDEALMDSVLYCDSDRMHQVLGNLLSNAIKVVPEHTAVTLRAQRRGAEMVFAVEDHGPGIAREDLPLIFEQFFRGREVSYKGTGLGLAICKGIVEGHGGRLWVESVQGSGTTFYVSLPAEHALQDSGGRFATAAAVSTQ